ncbi:MAG: hypothetical protein DWQ31_07030 [Planctomycetota bacterium]|nr:MAG: hypothetical protein DWQ31_07030 [Planctomycetota bacterium]REJ89549.1 MAG: hypothetical protein DWQ35_17825 [Planctomycetota bacterium]REK31412.1 MAG: hypothetical protein DWQ42_00335 [Planctomycetota bacterium]REK40642.1 MAG: hypothetical protein DWQ46_15475 [Planctomycetota bacterium]
MFTSVAIAISTIYPQLFHVLDGFFISALREIDLVASILVKMANLKPGFVQSPPTLSSNRVLCLAAFAGKRGHDIASQFVVTADL